MFLHALVSFGSRGNCWNTCKRLLGGIFKHLLMDQASVNAIKKNAIKKKEDVIVILHIIPDCYQIAVKMPLKH